MKFKVELLAEDVQAGEAALEAAGLPRAAPAGHGIFVIEASDADTAKSEAVRISGEEPASVAVEPYGPLDLYTVTWTYGPEIVKSVEVKAVSPEDAKEKANELLDCDVRPVQ